MTLDPLLAVSPLDGRYHTTTAPLAPYCSEMALMRHRLHVEVEYLIALAGWPGVTFLRPLTEAEIDRLRGWAANFSPDDAARIKAIEAETRHDTKAVELFLAEQFAGTSLDGLQPGLHFALTSEDVSNLAYALMIKGAFTAVLLPALDAVDAALVDLAGRYAALPLLARTHGQPATPTTLGKEFAVFAVRLRGQRAALEVALANLPGKLTGATGNFNAHVAAYPDVDWRAFSQTFVTALGLRPNLHTTQIEPGDGLVEVLDALARCNRILLDLCQDMWRYISDGVFRQRVVAGEVGSSTMPHKVNPIQFENAEGNLDVADALLSLLARRLPVSRLQRDLSNSTVIRNAGVALAHALLAYANIRRGLDRIAADEARIAAMLDDQWAVVTEAIQTILRREGRADAYDLLKTFSRGAAITRADITAFIDALDVPEPVRVELRALSPGTYTGLAEVLARLV
jgi:adenylosuccinate lyase